MARSRVFSYSDLFTPYTQSNSKVESSDNGVIINCRAAGLEKEQIKIKVDRSNILCITSDSEIAKDKAFIDVLDLQYRLSDSLDPAKLKATLKNGILRIDLPYNENRKKDLFITVE